MSFSSKVKEELVNKIDTAKHCQIAELAAIIALNGFVLQEGSGMITLVLTTENAFVAQKYVELLGKAFDVSKEAISESFEGKKNSIMHLALFDQPSVRKILMALKWYDESTKMVQPKFVHKLLIQKECCKRAFIRGAFLASGSISDPNKFYHYEIVCTSLKDAQVLQEIFEFFHLDAKVIQRKRNYVVYMKEGNHITDALNVMGAFVSQMDLYNIMILKGMRNDVNRKVNCETANLNKTVEAAVKQIRDIEYIRDTIGIESLADNLIEVAYIRLENPDMNLKAIGELLTPAVGKSGVNHRLRKISEIAEKLRSS